jgi:hypothetical protein
MLGRPGEARSHNDIMLERTIMRRILVLASAAAVAMLAFSPLAQAQTSSQTPASHSTTVHKKVTHVAKAKKKAPVKHKVAAKKVVKKKKPAVRTSAAAPHGIQA